jgi:hypothetical protein
VDENEEIFRNESAAGSLNESEAGDSLMTDSGIPISTKPPVPTDPLAKRVPKAKAKFPPAIKLKTYEASVARHIARIFVNKSSGDMADTIRWMRPGFKDEEYDAYARHVLQQEHVREAIEAEYVAIGIDEKARAKYIGQLWKFLTEGNEKTKQVVLGLLGRALGIGEMADETRVPAELPIKGLEKGWKQMTGVDAIAAQNPTGFSKLNEEGEPGTDDF